MTEIGTVIDGKYEILKEIGRGGMSIVYLAMDKHLNKQWAVKEIRKKGNGKNDEVVVNSLLAEANLMKRLDHPSLPRIVDIIDNGITIYVVMDYIEGESLDKILNEYGAQPEELVIAWAKQLCDALSYLHSQKPPIIYRDMKPANVMLKPEGNIKIIDFGIAREYKEQNLADTTVLGTKGYAPPEQYSGQTDARSDIFALGMTLHHLLTGVDPRNGEPYASVRQWNPELSEGIEIIIDKCVEPAAENRYQNCADLLYDLEHPELITKGYKRQQKRKLGAFIGAAVLSVVTLISGYVCDLSATTVRNNTYESYVGVLSTTSFEEKIASYKQAIAIKPYEAEAYLKMLEAYESEGRFGKSESAEFVAVYNVNKDGFDYTSLDVVELNYKLGMMYLNYYSGDGTSGNDVGFQEKIQKAMPCFKVNHENPEVLEQFEKRQLSETYYQICTFYDQYVFRKAEKSYPTKADYDELLEAIEVTMSDISEEGIFDQLSFYNASFNLIYDQRDFMKMVSVNGDDVLALFDRINDKAMEIPGLDADLEELRSEMENNYDEYRIVMERLFRDTDAEEVE